jgi:putative transposase
MTLYNGEYRIESTRLPIHDYASGWYFVTICTHAHRCILGGITDSQIILSARGTIARRELEEIGSHYDTVELDCWVIMPNHVHAIFIIEGGNEGKSVSLATVVGSYKSAVSRKCRLSGWEFSWQPRFYDCILRSDASVNAVRDYIRDNPKNWEKDPDRSP